MMMTTTMTKILLEGAGFELIHTIARSELALTLSQCKGFNFGFGASSVFTKVSIFFPFSLPESEPGSGFCDAAGPRRRYKNRRPERNFPEPRRWRWRRRRQLSCDPCRFGRRQPRRSRETDGRVGRLRSQASGA